MKKHLQTCKGSRKKAFTLAEVLVTLGVIGVVAAMTMPTLMQNHQKSVYVNQLKKTFSVVSQGLESVMQQDNAVSFKETNLYSLLSKGASIGDVAAEVQKYFKVTKSCLGDCGLECQAFNGGDCSGPYVWTYGDAHIYTFFLSDGAVVGFYTESSHDGGVMDIVVDVNGTKVPNKYGRDIFRFALDEENKVVPWDDMGSGECYLTGSDGDPCGSSGDLGWCCAQRIIANGWEMDY